MRHQTLHIGDTNATFDPVICTCFGLGFCIALYILDRVTGLAGAAHIALPCSLDDGEFLGAMRLIDALLANFRTMGRNLHCLRAKITTGVQVYESMIDIGKQNIQAVVQQFFARRIFVAAADVVGHIARTARFNSLTGEFIISTADRKPYTILTI